MLPFHSHLYDRQDVWTSIGHLCKRIYASSIIDREIYKLLHENFIHSISDLTIVVIHNLQRSIRTFSLTRLNDSLNLLSHVQISYRQLNTLSWRWNICDRLFRSPRQLNTLSGRWNLCDRLFRSPRWLRTCEQALKSLWPAVQIS